MEEDKTIVVDIGSANTRVGFAGEEAPKHIVPTILGDTKENPKVLLYQVVKMRDIYVGDEAIYNSGLLDLWSPVQRGVVTNWNDMEKYLDYILKVLFHDVKISDYNFLFSEPMFRSKSYSRKSREYFCQIMYEKFNVPNFSVLNSNFLAYNANGRTSCVTVLCGDSITSVLPLHNGYVLTSGAKKLDLGGRDVTCYLRKLLNKHSPGFQTINEYLELNEIKEKYCYVSTDDTSKSAVENITHRFDNGKEITIGKEMYECGELLFTPYVNGFEIDGISQTIYDSISTCEGNIPQHLYYNVILSGGSMQLKGFAKRIENELLKLTNNKMKINVKADKDQVESVWIGGSIMGSCTSFNNFIVSNKEYKENGTEAINAKGQPIYAK
ncbi:actin [Histomonas meleagridis]|uniref:actin n=1 Tax=Histomonas meleagridis TaxID=135588 RepID=UPI00355A03D6|nr:actin [Histomonas meleagridis]KAH0806583.1 actin [Histomonas meleagridis]